MSVRHVVQSGECISSIALRYGFHPDTIWNAPENAELAARRASGNVLVPGDELVIPDKTPKRIAARTGVRHVFRRRGVPEIYQVRFLDSEGKPRAGLPYEFVVGQQRRQGTLDDAGALREWIPPDLGSAEVALRDGRIVERHRVRLGRLQPVTELRGVQARLAALGFICDEDGEMNISTRKALRSFQRRYALEVTGIADDVTRDKLVELYGI